jgi:hypothetical protein
VPGASPRSSGRCVRSGFSASAGFSRRQTKGGSRSVCTVLRVGWRSDEYGGNGGRLQPGPEVAPGEREDMSKDRRHVEFREADRQPRLGNAGIVRGPQARGRSAARTPLMELSLRRDSGRF